MTGIQYDEHVKTALKDIPPTLHPPLLSMAIKMKKSYDIMKLYKTLQEFNDLLKQPIEEMINNVVESYQE